MQMHAPKAKATDLECQNRLSRVRCLFLRTRNINTPRDAGVLDAPRAVLLDGEVSSDVLDADAARAVPLDQDVFLDAFEVGY